MSNNNWKLCAVKKKAASLGLRVEFARKLFGPKHIQNRIYINGHRCQLATRRHQPEEAAQPAVSLQTPAGSWAHFVIYVPPPGQDAPFLIVPRKALNVMSPQSDHLLEGYADTWFLLKGKADRLPLSAP